jgi:hypothetical protein
VFYQENLVNIFLKYPYNQIFPCLNKNVLSFCFQPLILYGKPRLNFLSRSLIPFNDVSASITNTFWLTHRYLLGFITFVHHINNHVEHSNFTWPNLREASRINFHCNFTQIKHKKRH